MASLTGTKIKDTYDSLIKVSDNGALDGTLQTLTDGLGNNSALSLSTAGASVTGTLAVSGATTLSDIVQVRNQTPTIQLYNTDTSVELNQILGDLDWYQSDPSGEGVGVVSRIRAINEGVIQGAGSLAFYTGQAASLAERMRIDSGGSTSIKNGPNNAYIFTVTNDASGSSYGSTNGKRLAFFRSDSTSIPDQPGIDLGYSTTGEGIIAGSTNGAGSPIAFYTYNGSSWGERMRIDASGNVGIGVTPTEKLHIQGSSPFIVLSNTEETESGITFLDSASVSQSAKITYDSGASNALIFYNNAASERMRITSGGDVLFGTQGIPNGTSIYGSAFRVNSNGRMTLNMATSNSGAQGHIEFYNPNGLVGSISTSGSATAYNTSSDYRLKEDWVAMEGALDRVDLLKPINFAWKADGSRVDGFLAHELAEVVPEAVTGEKDAAEIRSVEVSPAVYEDVIHPAEEAVYETIEHPAIAEELDEEGNVLVEAQDAWTEEVLVSEAKEEWVEKVLVSEAVFEDQEFPVYQGIDQSKIVPLLVAAIQELRAEIEALKA